MYQLALGPTIGHGVDMTTHQPCQLRPFLLLFLQFRPLKRSPIMRLQRHEARPRPPPSLHISQTVAYQAHEAWGRSTAARLTAEMTAAQSGDPTAVPTAVAQLMDVPHRALDGQGCGGAQETVARLRLIKQGEPTL